MSKEVRSRICKIISEMLSNPDVNKSGIYPTRLCYDKFENWINGLNAKIAELERENTKLKSEIKRLKSRHAGG